MPPLLKNDPDHLNKIYNYFNRLHEEHKLANELDKIVNGDLTNHTLHISHPTIIDIDCFVETNKPLELNILLK